MTDPAGWWRPGNHGLSETIPDFDIELEDEGMMVSGNVVAVTEAYAFSSEGETLEVVCELRLERVMDASAGCVAEPDGQPGGEAGE